MLQQLREVLVVALLAPAAAEQFGVSGGAKVFERDVGVDEAVGGNRFADQGQVAHRGAQVRFDDGANRRQLGRAHPLLVHHLFQELSEGVDEVLLAVIHPRSLSAQYSLFHDPDTLREFCLSLRQAVETFSFGEQTSVFKTSGNDKLFALTSLDAQPLTVTLKCNPEESLALQEEFSQVTPGYHMNKKHWITVVVEGFPEALLEQLISDSHALVAPRIR